VKYKKAERRRIFKKINDELKKYDNEEQFWKGRGKVRRERNSSFNFIIHTSIIRRNSKKTWKRKQEKAIFNLKTWDKNM
jgi:hypothetical protein